MYLRPYSIMRNLGTCAVVIPLTGNAIKTPGVTITAARANTGNVYVGTSAVANDDYFADLAAGDSLTLTAQTLGWANADIDLGTISLVGSTTGTVSVVWLGRKDEDDA